MKYIYKHIQFPPNIFDKNINSIKTMVNGAIFNSMVYQIYKKASFNPKVCNNDLSPELVTYRYITGLLNSLMLWDWVNNRYTTRNNKK